MNPAHPVYIISKGRWKRTLRLTDRALHEMGVPHFVVVEPQEHEVYAHAVTRSATVLVLDPAYKAAYQTCDPAGDAQGMGTGSGPARNFAWDHAAASGAAFHWIMDDNIYRFYRLHRNAKIPVADGTILRVMEAFTERYENVAMAGPAYESFVRRREKWPPFVANTRLYSCILIRNDIPYRWRSRYNEDVDLSLRVLKDGWATVEFFAFLQNKIATQRLRGGNTTELYAGGTLRKSQVLVDLHPDVAQLAWKFNRWHHVVNYGAFRRNELRRRPDLVIPNGPDEFGMVLEQRDQYGDWVPA